MQLNINIIYHIEQSDTNKNETFSTYDIAEEYGLSSQNVNNFLVDKNILKRTRTKKGKLSYILQKPYKNMGYQMKFSGTSLKGQSYKNYRWTLKGKKLIKDLLEQDIGVIFVNKSADNSVINNQKKQNKQLVKSYFNNNKE